MKTDRKKIHSMFGGRCAYCGDILPNESGKYMQVDHLNAVHRHNGIMSRPANDDIKYPACCSCNNYKSTFGVDGLRKWLKSLPDRLVRDSVGFRIALRYKMVEVKKWDGVFWFEKYNL